MMSWCSPKVAYQGPPTYNFAEILKPLVGKSEHHVVNSKEFITKIEQTKLGDKDKILVNFYAVSSQMFQLMRPVISQKKDYS